MLEICWPTAILRSQHSVRLVYPSTKTVTTHRDPAYRTEVNVIYDNKNNDVSSYSTCYVYVICNTIF